MGEENENMTNNESEYIIEQWKKMKYSALEKKSDNELRNIVSNNAEKIMAIPLNPTTSQLSEMYQLTGENRAAGEILSKREAKSEK